MSQTDSGLVVVSNFSKTAQRLRADFEERFGDPLKAGAKRFVWDYWNIPGQYTLLRAPLSSIFSAKASRQFLDELSAWSQDNLGMTTLSEPWVSCYVEGCEQRFHTDAAHGPWAFVYSLTPAIFFKKAQGGFTRIAKDFAASDIATPREEPDLFTDVDSAFNRLIVFDPRRPHAVERVRGVQDLREARLVIHGWLTDPQPFYTAKLSRRVAREARGALENAVGKTLSDLQATWQGLGVLRVGRSGKVEWLSSLLVEKKRLAYLNTLEKKKFLKHLQSRVEENANWLSICGEMGSSTLTLPFECVAY